MEAIGKLAFSDTKLSTKRSVLIAAFIVVSISQAVHGVSTFGNLDAVNSNNYLLKSARLKRSIENLPNDAQLLKNIDFNLYGSNGGAYITTSQQQSAQRVQGVDGHVINSIRNGRIIYIQVQRNTKIFEYYALNAGEVLAKRIHGIPNDAELAASYSHRCDFIPIV